MPYCGGVVVLVVVDVDPAGVDDMVPWRPRWLLPVVAVIVVELVVVVAPVVADGSVVVPGVVAPAGAIVSGVVVVVVVLPGVIWAPAADASTAAVTAIRIFIVFLLGKNQRGGGAGLVEGLAGMTPGVVARVAPGASMPTRPSPMVPVVAAPTGGVTPVAGIGSVGLPATPPGVGAPTPGIAEGVVPAGAYGTGAVLPGGVAPTWANAGAAVARATTIVKPLIIMASSDFQTIT